MRTVNHSSFGHVAVGSPSAVEDGLRIFEYVLPESREPKRITNSIFIGRRGVWLRRTNIK